MLRLPLRLCALLLLTAPLVACETDDAPARGEAPPVRTAAQVDIPEPDDATARLFEDVMAYARRENLHERPIGAVMQAVGLQFRGKPYMAGLLDEPTSEQLVCRLDGFDCVTFVETALAMARAIKQQDYSYETFARNLIDGRYRGGTLDGYCSRLHYFSEWILDNEERGRVENISDELGGDVLDKEINFMSQNRDKYARFDEPSEDEVLECVRDMEARLADIEIFYIPEDEIAQAYDQLQAGDIIATATDIAGLDVTHTGLVYDEGAPGGPKGFLHASTKNGVTVSEDLQSYIQNNGVQIGIVVARPQSP